MYVIFDHRLLYVLPWLFDTEATARSYLECLYPKWDSVPQPRFELVPIQRLVESEANANMDNP